MFVDNVYKAVQGQSNIDLENLFENFQTEFSKPIFTTLPSASLTSHKPRQRL